MAALWAAVILGISIPFVVPFTSSKALLSGAEPSVLMPTFCEKAMPETRRKKTNKSFLMLIVFVCIVKGTGT
jgi:hypothetical protein